MIRLICNHCKVQLSVDDAFAGGACRCQHCGTIQTVPSRLKQKSADTLTSTGPIGAAPAAANKTLYQNQPHPSSGRSGVGLADLADAVASSGLSSQRLRSASAPGARSDGQRSPSMLLGIAVALLAILGLALWLMSGSERNPTTSSSSAAPIAGSANPLAAPALPSRPPEFCGVPLDDRVVIYVIDRGNATGEYFDRLKQACFKSVESLGPERKFQVIFWNNGSDVAYPNTGPTFASTLNIEAARKALDEVVAHGQSDVTSALTRAIAADPGTIVLATGKGYELDESFVSQVEKIRGHSSAKIYTFAVGSGESGSALKVVAQRSGGRFTFVPPAALREASE